MSINYFLLSLLSLSWEDGGGGSGGIPMIMLGSLGSNLGNTGLGIDLTACDRRERERKEREKERVLLS